MASTTIKTMNDLEIDTTGPVTQSEMSTLDVATPSEISGKDAKEYAKGWKIFSIMATINLSTMIAALDLGIVATAIPAITNEFHGIDAIGWYSAACFLLVGCTSAMWGKMFKYLNAKWTYAGAVAIYLVGSIVAASAPNSNALIVGRAIQGWGCSGTISGSAILINYTMEPARRPVMIGTWFAVFMLSTVFGPVLGGIFTTEVTWRWCFWINLPIGGAALVLQVLVLQIPNHIKPAPSTWKELILHLDIPGFAMLLSSNVCFILALQWGGLTKSWSDGSVIATLVMFGVLTVAFILVEWYSGEFAMMPLRLLKTRMSWSQCLYGMMTNGYYFQVLFYLPIYFQSVRSVSAILSGVYSLPMVGFFAIGSVISGAGVGKTLMIHPFQLAGALLAIIGTGLLYGLRVESNAAWYICAQIPLGLGSGMGTQVPVTALQAFSKPQDVATITGIIFTFQSLAGSYMVVSAQSVFENKLIQALHTNAPSVDPDSILGAGASQIYKLFSGHLRVAVLNSYMTGVKDVFLYSIALAAAASLFVGLIPFIKLPTPQNDKREKIDTSRTDDA